VVTVSVVVTVVTGPFEEVPAPDVLELVVKMLRGDSDVSVVVRVAVDVRATDEG